MTERPALYDSRPPAVIITLNRPDKRNALSRALIVALTEAFERARDDAAARCVILTGADPVFCAGMDLAELQSAVGSQESGVRSQESGVRSQESGVRSQESGVRSQESGIWEDALQLARLYDLIYALSKPTIAAVNGAAVAGGAGLVTVCDLALAAPEARFGYPEVRRGLVAAMVMPHLLRHVGERLARWLLLSGELIDAAQACRTGLINAVVPPGQLLEQAHAWAVSLAEGGPEAQARTKAILRQLSHQALSVEETARASAAPRLTEECQQGLRAFFAKQSAPWSPQ